MTHDELVLEAMVYRRDVGADLAEVRAYVSSREAEKRSARDDRKALERLEAAGRAFRVGRRWFLTPEARTTAKGPRLRPTYQPEDAWVLLALIYSEGPARLEQVVAVADYINHAILTLEEMHGALNRLASARLVRARRGGFEATAIARDLGAKVKAARGTQVYRQLEGLGQILNCPCCGPPLETVRWRIGLTEEVYEEAVARYRSLFE